MHIKHSLFYLPLVTLLFFAIPALAATATQKGAVEQGKAEAATLLQQGKAAEAYELYSSLLREAPEDDAINLGLARSAMAASRPNQALMAYLRLLEKYPKEAALHKEIAQAYMALGDREKAEQHLTRDPKLSAQEADSALNALDKRYERFQVHGTVRSGLVYDTNANQGPASSTMNIGLWQNVQVSGAKAKETMGGYLGAQLDLGYRLEQAGPWWLVGDVQTYARGNSNNALGENTNRYWQWGRVATGARYLTSQNLFDMRFKSEIFDYELNQHVLAAGPELLYVHALRPKVQLVSRGGVDLRDYTGGRQRNGPYWNVGQYGRVFFGEQNHEFMLGGRYAGASANQNDFSYNGWEASARFIFKLPYHVELSPHLSYGEDQYKGPATALETTKRKDERLRTGVGVNWRFTEGWSVETSWQYTDNTSNSSLNQYKQHLFSLGMAWNF